MYSLVIPLYNEELMVPVLRTRLTAVLDSMGMPWEIVFVDDGSKDKTRDLLHEWQLGESRVVVVHLSRNFGHQAAVIAGLEHSRGEVVAIIDGDLQDPPEILSAMHDKLQEGYDVVYGVRKNREEGRLLKFCYWLAYRIINSLAECMLPEDSGDFCTMRRCVVDKMLELKEHFPYLRGLRAWLGYRQISFEYDRGARAKGGSKYSLRDLVKLTRDGIFGFTRLPMKLVRLAGTGAIAFSCLYFLFLLISYCLGHRPPAGFSTLIVVACLFAGAQLFSIGLLGEYVCRIYEDVRGRPRYVVSSVAGRNEKSNPTA